MGIVSVQVNKSLAKMEALFGKWKVDKSSIVNAKELLTASGKGNVEETLADMMQRETEVAYSMEGGQIKYNITLTNSDTYSGEKTVLYDLGKEKVTETKDGEKIVMSVTWNGKTLTESIGGPAVGQVFTMTKTVDGDVMTE